MRSDNQPISLGELIALLETRPQEQDVRFDFGYIRPVGVDSYRGFYDHLAIEYTTGGKDMTVAELLAELRGAVGRVFMGYKGGDFRMNRSTPMWVANHGESNSTAVIGLAECKYMTIIATGYCDEWAGGLGRALQVLGGLGFGNAHLPVDADA